MRPLTEPGMPLAQALVIAGGGALLLGLGLLAGVVLSHDHRPQAPAIAAGAETTGLNRTGSALITQGESLYTENVVGSLDRHVTGIVQAPVDGVTKALQNRLPGFLAPEVSQLGGMAKTRLRDAAVESAAGTGKAGFGTLRELNAVPAADPAPWWSVELGRFARLPSADAFAQRMGTLGVGTRTTMTVGGDGREWASVRTGLYADQSEAEKALESLRGKGFSGTVVSETKGSGGHVER